MPATLLLADDSVTIQRVIELTFANEDVRVIAVGDGVSAVERIDAEPPDVVLADVGMPKLDGYGVASHIKSSPRLRHIPVLLLTGAFEPIDEDQARATGCDGILVKPFEPQQLVSRVRELLAGRRSAELWPKDLPRVEPAAVVPAARPAPPRVPQPPVPGPAEILRPMPTPPSRTPPLSAPHAAPSLTLSLRPTDPPSPVLRPLPPDPPLARPAPVPAAIHVDPPEPVGLYSAPASPTEAAFEMEFDQLDAAFAQIDPVAAPAGLDPDTVSDFARDLDLFRHTTGAEPASVRADDGRRENPPLRAASGSIPSSAVPAELPAAAADDWNFVDDTPSPEPAAPPATPHPTPISLARAAIPPADPPLSIASAFSALLAAEQAQPPARHAPASPASLSEAAVEEMVRRVLARMTDDTVRKVVLDTAERLIREEIQKVRAHTE